LFQRNTLLSTIRLYRCLRVVATWRIIQYMQNYTIQILEGSKWSDEYTDLIWSLLQVVAPTFACSECNCNWCWVFLCGLLSSTCTWRDELLLCWLLTAESLIELEELPSWDLLSCFPNARKMTSEWISDSKVLSWIYIVLICLHFSGSLDSSPRGMRLPLRLLWHREKLWGGEGRKHALLLFSAL
jgi:hypothetical protein